MNSDVCFIGSPVSPGSSGVSNGMTSGSDQMQPKDMTIDLNKEK